VHQIEQKTNDEIDTDRTVLSSLKELPLYVLLIWQSESIFEQTMIDAIEQKQTYADLNIHGLFRVIRVIYLCITSNFSTDICSIHVCRACLKKIIFIFPTFNIQSDLHDSSTRYSNIFG
jgi:hypothetical protein